MRINNGETTGMDLTILILCDMFSITAMVLHEDHLWKSQDVELNDFDVYLTMMGNSRFCVCYTECRLQNFVQFPVMPECGRKCLDCKQSG